MARIEVVQTGARVTTVIRGREMRPRFSSPKQSNTAKPKERRMVCVLNHHAGRMLEHWSVSEPCFGPKCHHHHQSREVVGKLVRDGILRYVASSGKNVAAYSYGRTWRGVMSDGCNVMQLVEG